MLTLYDNPFSPFTRKVRMVLDHKGLAFESIDALAKTEHARLLQVNPRGEAPVLVDDGLVVVDSSDIVAYLEDRYPDPPVMPADPARRAAARAWQRCADTVLDAIIHDLSIWTWPTHQRPDTPPAGLLEAGQRDIAVILGRLERALPEDGYLCGDVSAADFALFPHLSALRVLGLSPDAAAFPRLARWNARMRSCPAVRVDLDRVKRAVAEKFGHGPSPYEGDKIVWRGDRLEWLFSRGFYEWWRRELDEGRVVIPTLPASVT